MRYDPRNNQSEKKVNTPFRHAQQLGVVHFPYGSRNRSKIPLYVSLLAGLGIGFLFWPDAGPMLVYGIVSYAVIRAVLEYFKGEQ